MKDFFCHFQALAKSKKGAAICGAPEKFLQAMP
jgi:hypothetical protein